jgi:hypothetical protein
MALPIKHWFYLNEVAKKWGCSEKDILFLGMNKELNISVPQPLQSTHVKYRSNIRQPWKIEKEWDCDDSLALYLVTSSNLDIIERVGACYINGGTRMEQDVQWLEAKNDYYEEGFDDFDNLDMYTECGYAFSINELRVSRLERDEFEKRNKVGGFSEESPDIKSNSISDTKEEHYKKIIGALLNLLKDKRTLPYTNSLIIEKLQEKYTNKDGFSQSSLEKKFAEAKKAIEDLG